MDTGIALLDLAMQEDEKDRKKEEDIYHVVKSEVEANKVGLEESMPATQGQGQGEAREARRVQNLRRCLFSVSCKYRVDTCMTLAP